MRKFIFLWLSGLIAAQIYAFGNKPQLVLNYIDRKFFIENKGQWHSDVLYLCRMGGVDIWITKYGINYTFFKLENNLIPNTEKAPQQATGRLDYEELENAILLGHRVLLKFLNHNSNPLPQGKQKLQEYYNYLIGNNTAKHATFVRLYQEVIVQNVYPGIDIRYYFDKGSLRFDFIVHPGADPNQITFLLEGQYDAYLKEDNLYFTTRFGEVAMMDLHTYQGDNSIESHFEKQDNTWKIKVSSYDKTKDIIIDPLIYSTYIGGSSYDVGYDIAIDDNGNAYITGYTSSPDYDTTAGAYQTTAKGLFDVFVTKLNAMGSNLIYSTYIGGSGNDFGKAIAIDNSGNVYITGNTLSTDFNVTAGVYQTMNDGSRDVFVTKVDTTGANLIYSTYIGGNNVDIGADIAIDDLGNAYITGYTLSSDYDITGGAYQAINEGWNDVFVTKLNVTGTSLIYSTYIGGSDYDYGYGIAIDGNGNAYITGRTFSTDYDTTAGAYQTTNEGWEDGFVTKLDTTGSNLIYSTYIGGSGTEYSFAITIDSSGNAYITGWTESTDYDITTGAYQSLNAGSYDAFITKFNTTGTNLIYSTYIGGSDYDYSNSITIDENGNAYITGGTYSTDFNITADAFQPMNEGNWDAFITKVNVLGSSLIYSSYIGGDTSDIAYSIAVDGNGNAYITGGTYSSGFDTTAGAYQVIKGGDRDVFVTKWNLPRSASVDLEQRRSISFLVFPNPNHGTFVIKAEKPAQFELLDLRGKRIQTYLLKRKTLKVQENLPAGIYFLQKKEDRAIQKVIIQN